MSHVIERYVYVSFDYLVRWLTLIFSQEFLPHTHLTLPHYDFRSLLPFRNDYLKP